MRRALVVLVILTVACSGPAGKPMASASPKGSPAASASPVKLSTGGIVEYTVPPPAVKPADCFTPCPPSVGSVALGGDGNIWFVDHNFKTVGRITPAGDVKQWSAGLDLIGGAQTIATGPDGNLYVNAEGGGGGRPDWILRVTPAGVITRLSAGQRPPGQGVPTPGAPRGGARHGARSCGRRDDHGRLHHDDPEGDSCIYGAFRGRRRHRDPDARAVHAAIDHGCTRPTSSAAPTETSGSPSGTGSRA